MAKGLRLGRSGPDIRQATNLRKPLIVIKVGGSALTDKNKKYAPRTQSIRQATRQIAAICKVYSLVLVHGAGSFGHIPVEKYRLAHGFKNSRQLKGLAVTKSKLLEWEMILDKALLKQKVPLVPFLASDFIVTRKGRIFSSDLRPLQNWLRLGCVPTVGGDIVPDSHQGFSILSGDQLAVHLALKLKAKRLIFATDVDGIFDSDPKLNPEAKLLTNLTNSTASRLVAKATSLTTPDVTGGMAGKIGEALVAARAGVLVEFVNLTKDDRLLKAALGRHVVSSRISRS
jgi:isopentenyl phosphate kinase